jgi:hypothetical protein
MLDTEGLITKLRNIIADGTTLALTDVYSQNCQRLAIINVQLQF